jgi:hypothetical protein
MRRRAEDNKGILTQSRGAAEVNGSVSRKNSEESLSILAALRLGVRIDVVFPHKAWY